MNQDNQGDPPRIRVIGEAEETPVFNCVALVGRSGGKFAARAANLDGIECHGRSEREALQKLVAEFKSVVADYTSRGEPIPWLDPQQTPATEESTRFLAVHL